MSLLNRLGEEAVRRGFIEPGTNIDLPLSYSLVRDMPYRRASSRQPEVTIDEWRGTCSGKHYLLKCLFSELGFEADLIVCTTVTQLDPAHMHPKLGAILKKSGGRFVDVHNYLRLHLTQGEMVVDATWPLSAKKYGFVVNDEFVLGKDQTIAANPIESWIVPEDRDPQEFKAQKLKKHFSEEELALREAFLLTLSQILSRA